MTKRPLVPLAYAALIAALGLAGFWLLATTLMAYDDEGYVLWSLRSYARDGGLYETVYSQYGPFFYVLFHALHAVFGLPFSNEFGRLSALACWLGTAGACGAIAWQLTRSHVAALIALALSFACLDAMINEPGHPGGLTTLLAAAGVLAATTALLRAHPVAFATACALAGTALALTKINVGAFFLIASATWLLANNRFRPSLVSETRVPRPTSLVPLLLALASMLAPLALMRSLWPEPWITRFAFTFACSALGLVLALRAAAASEHGRRSWIAFVGSGALLALIVLGAVVARGTGFSALWNGMVVAPLSHPGVYSFPVKWMPGATLAAASSLAFAALVHLAPRRSWMPPFIAVLRLAAGACFLAGAFSVETSYLARFAFNFGPPLAWLMAFPLTVAPGSPAHRGRLWLAWAFTWQTLHAYPVAGSQLGWGAVLWAPLFVVGATEAVQVAAGFVPRLARPIAAACLIALASLTATAAVALGRIGNARYAASDRLEFPGAAWLRPPPETSRQLRVVRQNIERHAGTLFSLPGLFSFNLWTGRPTPTGSNVTHWFSLLPETDQQEIIDRLEADPRAAVVVHRYLVDFLLENGFPVEGPLHRYLTTSFERAIAVGHFELHVHRGRTVAPLWTARMRPPSPAEQLPQGQAGIRLEITAPAIATPIAAIELRPLAGNQPLQTLRPDASGRWTIQNLGDDGTPAAAPREVSAPFTLPGTVRISLTFEPSNPLPLPGDMRAAFLDASGNEIGSACFVK